MRVLEVVGSEQDQSRSGKEEGEMRSSLSCGVSNCLFFWFSRDAHGIVTSAPERRT
jgi:hypothetical protein